MEHLVGGSLDVGGYAAVIWCGARLDVCPNMRGYLCVAEIGVCIMECSCGGAFDCLRLGQITRAGKRGISVKRGDDQTRGGDRKVSLHVCTLGLDVAS